MHIPPCFPAELTPDPQRVSDMIVNGVLSREDGSDAALCIARVPLARLSLGKQSNREASGSSLKRSDTPSSTPTHDDEIEGVGGDRSRVVGAEGAVGEEGGSGQDGALGENPRRSGPQIVAMAKNPNRPC